MSRIEVTIRYVGEKVELYNTNGVIQTIVPNEIFSVGNSIGGFWAKPIKVRDHNRLLLINVSGTQKYWDTERLEKKLIDVKGIVLFPGDVGFWAVTSGAARNGIFHRKKPESDPLKKYLREDLHISTRAIEYVHCIDHRVKRGGSLCSHVSSGMDYYFITDGDSSLQDEGEFAPSNHRNQYHRGCQTSPALYQVSGGSFLVTFSRDEHSGTKVESVILTSVANKEEVVKKIKSFYQR